MAITQALGSERRRYFRINDEVALNVRPVSQEDIEEQLKRRTDGRLDTTAIASSFAASSIQMKHTIDKVRRTMPEMAAYLDAMNTKMDLLVRLLIANESALPDHPTHDVNISASGLAFRFSGPLELDQALELRLMFFPSFLYLTTFATVIRCVEEEGDSAEFPFAVAVEFAFLDDDDREMLIRHVVHKESELLRSARDTPVSAR